MLLKCQSAWCSTEKSLKSICKMMASKFGMSDAVCILGLHSFVCVYTVCWEKLYKTLGMSQCIHPYWLTFPIQFFFPSENYILYVCVCLSVQVCGCVSECACVCVRLLSGSRCVGVCVCGKRTGGGHPLSEPITIEPNCFGRVPKQYKKPSRDEAKTHRKEKRRTTTRNFTSAQKSKA